MTTNRATMEAARDALAELIDAAETVTPEYESTPGVWQSDVDDAKRALTALEAALSAPETGAGGEVEWEEGPNGVHVAKVRGKQIGTVFAAHPPVRIWLRNAIHMAEERGEVAPDDVDGAKAAVEASFRSALSRLTGGARLPSRRAIAEVIARGLVAQARPKDGPVDPIATMEPIADAVLSLLSAAPRVPVGGEGVWQPIETAPRDGTRILVLVPPASIVVAHWWGGKFRLHTLSSLNKLGQPTDWMPLPSFPTKGGADA